MYVSERYCSPQGFCAYKDGDRGLGSWYLFPGALQSTTQSQGVMESALPPTLCTFPAQPRHLKPPLLTAPLSHCGPASCSEDCTGLPGRQAPHSPVPQTQLPGQPCRKTTSSGGLLVTKAWEPCACCP